MLPAHGEKCYPLWYKNYRAKVAATLAVDMDSEEWKQFANFFHTLPIRLKAAMDICQQLIMEKKIKQPYEDLNKLVHTEHYRVWCALHYHYSYWQTDEGLRSLLTSVELKDAKCDYEQPLFTKFASFLVSGWKMASVTARSAPQDSKVPSGFELIDFIEGSSLGIGHDAFHHATFLTSSSGSLFGDRKRKASAEPASEPTKKKQRADLNEVIHCEDEEKIEDIPSPRAQRRRVW